MNDDIRQATIKTKTDVENVLLNVEMPDELLTLFREIHTKLEDELNKTD